MREVSKRDGAFVHACLAIINNRRLPSCESNRHILESLLNPGEEPTSKIYIALAERYPQRLAREPVSVKPAKGEQRAAFERYVRDHNLSSCDANFRLFTQGAELENFARASKAEEAAYAQEAAHARQDYLIQYATVDELKAEARYQFPHRARCRSAGGRGS